MPTRDYNLVEKRNVEFKTKLYEIILYSWCLNYKIDCVVAAVQHDGGLNIILIILNVWRQYYIILLY